MARGDPTTPEPVRAVATLHRDAVAAVDKITDFATGDIATADNGSGTGSLLANTTYYITVIPGNRWGPCKVAGTINTKATAASGLNTHSIRVTFAAATGAEWYDMFLSTDAAPKLVARVTEAQRAAGDFEITAMSTVAAGGGNPAGSIDVNVAGTGIQTSNAIFAQNNAYRPTAVTAIDCTGYSQALILVKLALTDYSVAPALRVLPFARNELSTNDWHAASIGTVPLLGALGQPQEAEFVLDVRAAPNLVIMIDTITGLGAAASIWVALYR